METEADRVGGYPDSARGRLLVGTGGAGIGKNGWPLVCWEEAPIDSHPLDVGACPMTEPRALLGTPTGSFPTTCWSLVLGAGHRSGPEAREALAMLCRAYWYPIYAFI